MYYNIFDLIGTDLIGTLVLKAQAYQYCQYKYFE